MHVLNQGKTMFTPKKNSENVLELFNDNKLIGRSKGTDNNSATNCIVDHQPFIEEIEVLLGKKKIFHERNDMEPHVRAASASLMIKDVPMFMFAEYGLLFDANNTILRKMWDQDAFTMPDNNGWGKNNTLTPSLNSKSLFPTTSDLAEQFKQLSEDYKNGKIGNHEFDNAPLNGILAHNEIKANLYAKGLVGLFYEKISRYQYNILKAESTQGITDEWTKQFEMLKKCNIYSIKADLLYRFNLDLPIFEWVSDKGTLVEWKPKANEIQEMVTFLTKTKQQQLFLENIRDGVHIAITQSEVENLYPSWEFKDLINDRNGSIWGLTPLYIAAKYENKTAFESLIALGAKLILNHGGNFPMNTMTFRYMLKTKDENLLDVFLNQIKMDNSDINEIRFSPYIKGNDCPPLIFAILETDWPLAVNKLLAAGAKKDLTFYGETAEKIAEEDNKTESLKALRSFKYSKQDEQINNKTISETPFTPKQGENSFKNNN